MNFTTCRKNSLVCQNNTSKNYLHYLFIHFFFYTLSRISANHKVNLNYIKYYILYKNIDFIVHKIFSFLTFYHFYGGITHLKKVTPIISNFFDYERYNDN